MTEQFSPKIYSRIAVNISKNSLLYIFSSTVTICVTISDMKILENKPQKHSIKIKNINKQ